MSDFKTSNKECWICKLENSKHELVIANTWLIAKFEISNKTFLIYECGVDIL